MFSVTKLPQRTIYVTALWTRLFANTAERQTERIYTTCCIYFCWQWA